MLMILQLVLGECRQVSGFTRCILTTSIVVISSNNIDKHNQHCCLTYTFSNIQHSHNSYQSLAFGQRTYLSSVLTPHQPQRSLRSVNQNLLSVPRCNSSFGQISFSYCAPKIWNDIPLSVRQSPSLGSFKRNL